MSHTRSTDAAHASPDPEFLRHFQAEVHLAYRQMGSKLRNTVRTESNVVGSTATFQKVGKGTGGAKWRHGEAQAADHSPVEVQLYDYYAGDWVDDLDAVKTDADARTKVVATGAYALGRKTDELIIAALDTVTNYAGTGADGLTKAKVLAAFEMLGEADVPDDGERYAIIGWKQWGDLLDIQEFAHADYAGDDELPWKGTQAKRWLGTLWMPHSNLTKVGPFRNCYLYNMTAIGHASGADVLTDVAWRGDRKQHFINNMMSQGAGVVDVRGVVSLRCRED